MFVLAICEEYRKISEYDLEHVVKKETTGSVEKGFLALIQSARNRPAFFANRAHKVIRSIFPDFKKKTNAFPQVDGKCTARFYW